MRILATLNNGVPKDGEYAARVSGYEYTYSAPDYSGTVKTWTWTHPTSGVRGLNIPARVTVQNGVVKGTPLL